MTVRRNAGLAIAGVAGVLLTAAGVNILLARKAERDHPPAGKFLRIGRVWLHYVDEGEGDPLILLHGNGSMIEDFRSSGLLAWAATKYRVIAFDRPGFGYSSRPWGRAWSPEAQADVIRQALLRLNVQRATIFAHSWGTFVALALALKDPTLVRGLVLASGYYFPPRDSQTVPGQRVRFLDDILRFTIMPLFARLTLPMVLRRIFAPAPIPEKLESFPISLAVRPWQLRAESEDAEQAIPAARRLSGKYRLLRMPVTLLAGGGDRLVSTEQSAEAQRQIEGSRLVVIPRAGHMLHYTATTKVMSAIDQVMAG